MTRTTRRSFAKVVAAASAALPIVAADLLAQTPSSESPPSPLAEALVGVVRAQSGQHLDDADIERIRADFKDYVPLLERLRSSKLTNADEPDYTFASLTKRWS